MLNLLFSGCSTVSKPTFYLVVLISVISSDSGYDTVQICAVIPACSLQGTQCLVMNVLPTMNVDIQHTVFNLYAAVYTIFRLHYKCLVMYMFN
jgi:hypothetical protein